MPALILIADDDPSIRRGLVSLCRLAGHRTLEAATGRETLAQTNRAGPDLVLLDLSMPEGTGLEILPEIVANEAQPAVVVLTGYADVHTAVEAMRLGAANLLQKPVDGAALTETIARTLAGRRLRDERDRLRQEVARLSGGSMLGESRAMQRLREIIERLVQSPRSTVLISGETGVGKELVARAIHEQGPDADEPFVAVNCAGLPADRLEAELFGYEAGAFTGARPEGHDGLALVAGGGTLLLDEIGELGLAHQAKLLRLLQERSFRRVGGNQELPLRARVLASTHRDLRQMVQDGSFREDLYYRLNVLCVHVAPLRERTGDIPPIALAFLERFAEELGRELTGFEEPALERLLAHPWPGNVRELRNVVERAALQTPAGRVRRESLGLEGGELAVGADAGPTLPLPGFNLRDMEALLIERAMRACSGNRSLAARELGINRSTLYNKLKAYGL